MREFTIGPNDAGQRLDRWLAKTLPLLPAPLAQKYIRIKRVKCNGKGAKRDTRLVQGDVLQLYINDEFFDTPTPENAFLSVFKPQLDIVYEAPALCNRIDRNTGGIVIAAKNAETLRVMNQKIRDREVEKSYLCIILGAITPPAGRLEGYLLKDEAKKLVSVHKTPVPGGRTAVTLYQTLAQKNGLSLVACRLVTGRTHQIRAQFAAAGHPLLGDGKYGWARENKKYGRTGGQALCSYQLAFRFTTDAGCLAGLNGRVWTVDQVDFVTDYFPHVPLHP